MSEGQQKLSATDRLRLIQGLNALPASQFNALLFALRPPEGNIPGNSAPQGSRSASLLEWVESPIGPGLSELEKILKDIAATRPKNIQASAPQNHQNQQVSEILQEILQVLQENQSPKYDLRGANIAGGIADTVHGNQVGGSVNSGSQKAHPETEAQKIRAKLLRRLKTDINTRLDSSLHNLVKIDLRMEDQRQRVGKHKLELVAEDPGDAQTQSSRSFTNRVFRPLAAQETPATTLEATQSLLPVLKRSDVQDRLLILGEPGAGKTTELVALAYDLLVQAEQDECRPIPIIFELSAWQENIPIEQWIIAQIKKVYKISESISQQWIHDEQLMPLLDGLDELRLAKQKQCIVAINQFLKEKIYPYTVVCCRREEYEKGQAELSQLRGAVYLQPLTNEQIQDYLRDLKRFSLWSSISANPELLELSRQPLFLTMVVVAYQGQPIRNESELFNAYIEKQLGDSNSQGAYLSGKAPSQQKTLHYLSWLAKQLEGLKETEFLIEEMQPSWLSSAYRRSYWLSIGLIVGLISGLGVSLGAGLSVGLISGLIFGLNGGPGKIEPIEKIAWSNRELISGLIFGLIGGLIFGLIGGLIFGLIGGLSIGLISGLIGGLASGLIGGLRVVRLEEKNFPNQGIQKSLQNTLVVTLISGLTYGLIDRLISGLTYGLIFGLIGGLKTVIQHYILRFLLVQEGSFPWDCIRFLDHAVNHRFIQRVGGRYRFIHDLLHKHFANGELPNFFSRQR